MEDAQQANQRHCAPEYRLAAVAGGCACDGASAALASAALISAAGAAAGMISGLRLGRFFHLYPGKGYWGEALQGHGDAILRQCQLRSLHIARLIRARGSLQTCVPR